MKYTTRKYNSENGEYEYTDRTVKEFENYVDALTAIGVYFYIEWDSKESRLVLHD